VDTLKISDLFKIVDEVKDYNRKILKPEYSKNSEEYGIYFKDPEGNYVLWFGVWHKFREEKGKAICFGVDKKDFDTQYVQRFQNMCKENLMEYENYIVSWIENDELLAEKNTDIIVKRIYDLLKGMTAQKENCK
jgi:hypothetical protein